jgi:Secretion system C-terminal sorting domain
MVSSILIHPNNPQKMWIALGGYDYSTNHRKVVKTEDGGLTWSDYAQGLLGNIPANALALNPNRIDDEELYVSTDLGIYYRNKYHPEWICFNGALPNTPVTDLKVNGNKKIITAATYGRGIWQSNLYCPSANAYTLPESPLNFYAALSSITSTSLITGNRKVAYRAPDVVLNAGFNLGLGCEFSAFSYSCNPFTPRSSREEDQDISDDTAANYGSDLDNLSLFKLMVFPMPIKGVFQVRYELKETTKVEILLLDAQGREIQKLYTGNQDQAGEYTRSFDAKDAKTGIYYLTLRSPSKSETKEVFIFEH